MAKMLTEHCYRKNETLIRKKSITRKLTKTVVLLLEGS